MLKILNVHEVEKASNLVGNDGKTFYAVWDNVDVDETPTLFIARSEKSYEDAAQKLWDMLCEYGGNFEVQTIVFLHRDKGFETDGVYGYMHYVFDHGHCTFDEMIMLNFKYEAGFEV